MQKRRGRSVGERSAWLRFSHAAVFTVLGLSWSGTTAIAQTLPSEPIVIGRVTVGGDVSATFSCASTASGANCGDDTGFFNYTEYEHSALRMFRADLTTAIRANDRLSVLAELRTENAERPQAYALYARIRPWVGRAFDVHIGRLPPTFGAFSRRTYPADNLLIGSPLAYQYLTSLRPDSLPATADELLQMRGRGWLSRFSIGDTDASAGVPLVSAIRWDTGVQAHAASERIEGTIAVTTGTLANPLVSDDNGGKQVAGRVVMHLTPGLTLGGSAARGPFVSRSAARAAGRDGRTGGLTQTAWGADAEYSRDYYLLRLETIVSSWHLPITASNSHLPLRAVSLMLEGRYKIRPGFYVAARGDHLGFSTITGAARTDQWEAPVDRIELGGGYAVQRNLLMKLAYQRNWRDGGRTAVNGVLAAQAVFWF
jgi:hypothetical protein